jgi:hypothetical protein
MSAPQVWRLSAGASTHRVEADPGFVRRVRWYVDGELVAEKRATEDKVRLESDAGRVELRFGTLGGPRRATLLRAGTDGDLDLDLVPDPGSPAARHEDRLRAHPHRYAALQTAGGVAKVVVPIVLATVLARFAFSLPWPTWSPDLPDLPDLPRPDLPWDPDLPDLPSWSLPGWVRWVLEHAKYVWPVVLAFVLAKAEVDRRRRQDAKREQLRDE